MPDGHRAMRVGRTAALVLLPVVLLLGGCQYDPSEFADTPALSECMGVPATIGIGWHESEGQDGDGDGLLGTTYYGTPGNDVVVITNGPVFFFGQGGDDLVCINDTGMAWGAEFGVFDKIGVVLGDGDDAVHVLTAPGGRAGNSSWFNLGAGTNAFYGSEGPEQVEVFGDDFVNTGGGPDQVIDHGGSGETNLGTGSDSFVAYDLNPDVVRGGEGSDWYEWRNPCPLTAANPDVITGFQTLYGGTCER